MFRVFYDDPGNKAERANFSLLAQLDELLYSRRESECTHVLWFCGLAFNLLCALIHELQWALVRK